MTNEAPTLRTIPIPTPKGGHKGDGMYRDDPCIVCGREVKNPKVYVHAVDGGDRLLHRDDEPHYESDGGDLYFHPVGPDCARLIPSEYLHRLPALTEKEE
jgi:hypothetical protein